jgi:hypothetical protein
MRFYLCKQAAAIFHQIMSDPSHYILSPGCVAICTCRLTGRRRQGVYTIVQESAFLSYEASLRVHA